MHLCVWVRVRGQGRGQAGVGPGCPLINSCWASQAGLDGWEGDGSWLGDKVESLKPGPGCVIKDRGPEVRRSRVG